MPAHSAASSSFYDDNERVIINASSEEAVESNLRKRRRKCFARTYVTIILTESGVDSTISENRLSPDATRQSAHGNYSSLDRTVQMPAHSAASSSYYDEDEKVFVNASLQQAERLFPPDLFESIKRYPDPNNKNIMVAAVSMSFPNEQLVPCKMSLEVAPNKVLHLARDLFHVRLEEADGFRYLCSDCTKVMPNPKLTLTGCKRNVLSSTFGLETFHGIEASSKYQHEGMQFRSNTNSVGMVISASEQEGASIYMSLGL